MGRKKQADSAKEPPRLVTSRKEVIDNIIKFNDELNEKNEAQEKIVKKLNRFKCWYAYEKNGKWYFCPSKFIGYKNMDFDFYNSNHHTCLDGRVTEKCLQNFSISILKNYLKFHNDLSSFLKYDDKSHEDLPSFLEYHDKFCKDLSSFLKYHDKFYKDLSSFLKNWGKKLYVKGKIKIIE